MTLSREQISELLKPVDPDRVKKANGYSHLEIYDIRARMNQIFGFGCWSEEVTVMELVTERQTTTKNDKPAWYVVYRAQSRITIHATDAVYTEWAAGESTHPILGEAHDMAIKTAESQATKRACVNLGDQFGLSLYDDGSTEVSVGEIIGYEYRDAGEVVRWLAVFEAAEDVLDLAPVVAEIQAAEISEADRLTLRQAYVAAEKRLKTPG